MSQKATATDEFIRERRAPEEPARPSVETTTPDRCGLLGAGDEFTYAVRNRALAGKEQFGESFVVAVSCGHSYTFHSISVSADLVTIGNHTFLDPPAVSSELNQLFGPQDQY